MTKFAGKRLELIWRSFLHAWFFFVRFIDFEIWSILFFSFVLHSWLSRNLNKKIWRRASPAPPPPHYLREAWGLSLSSSCVKNQTYIFKPTIIKLKFELSFKSILWVVQCLKLIKIDHHFFLNWMIKMTVFLWFWIKWNFIWVFNGKENCPHISFNLKGNGNIFF